MTFALLLILVSILISLLGMNLAMYFLLDRLKTENFELWTEVIDELAIIEALTPEKTEEHNVGDIHNV